MLEYGESSNQSMTLQEVLTRHEAVFKEGLGTWTGPPAKKTCGQGYGAKVL